MKNGLQAIVSLGGRCERSAYGVYTRFLQDAGVDAYFTVGGEIGYKPFTSFDAYLRLGFYSDLASDSKSELAAGVSAPQWRAYFAGCVPHGCTREIDCIRPMAGADLLCGANIP